MDMNSICKAEVSDPNLVSFFEFRTMIRNFYWQEGTLRAADWFYIQGQMTFTVLRPDTVPKLGSGKQRYRVHWKQYKVLPKEFSNRNLPIDCFAQAMLL